MVPVIADAASRPPVGLSSSDNTVTRWSGVWWKNITTNAATHRHTHARAYTYTPTAVV